MFFSGFIWFLFTHLFLLELAHARFSRLDGVVVTGLGFFAGVALLTMDCK